MKGFIAIIKRELKAYYGSPVAYATGVVFLVIVGFFNQIILGAFSEQSMAIAQNPQYAAQGMSLSANEQAIPAVLANMGVILLFVLPLLTMRLFAEEKRSGTDELLFTSPVSTTQIVLAKFTAANILLVLFLGLTLACPFFFDIYGGLDWKPVMAGYLGVFLMASSFLAIGLLASSLTENQIVAAVITFGILLIFWVIGFTGESASGTTEEILNYLSLYNHLDGLTQGVLDTKDIVYYLSVTGFGLFLTHQVLEGKRWR